MHIFAFPVLSCSGEVVAPFLVADEKRAFCVLCSLHLSPLPLITFSQSSSSLKTPEIACWMSLQDRIRFAKKTLLYKSSVDGETTMAFGDRCKVKSALVLMARLEDGSLVGGYSKLGFIDGFSVSSIGDNNVYDGNFSDDNDGDDGFSAEQGRAFLFRCASNAMKYSEVTGRDPNDNRSYIRSKIFIGWDNMRRGPCLGHREFSIAFPNTDYFYNNAYRSNSYQQYPYSYLSQSYFKSYLEPMQRLKDGTHLEQAQMTLFTNPAGRAFGPLGLPSESTPINELELWRVE